MDINKMMTIVMHDYVLFAQVVIVLVVIMIYH